MDYQLIRSKRKTLSLQINNDAELIVRAPNRLSVKKIEQFIDEKSTWINQKIQTVRAKIITQRKYITGEYFLYLGEEFPLIINPKKSHKLDFDGVNFQTTQANKTIFLAWYKSAFKKIALPRLDYYAKTHQLTYQKVRLKTQKTLWGSCSGVNNINLNYLLIMAPIAVIDYVIVHELAHTIHKNHSPDFWQLVVQILPNYKTSKRWLRENTHRLQNL
jgi:predicted metal-dependent hydrolase